MSGTKLLKKNKGLHPTQVLALGFFLIIILGGILLSLPNAMKNGESMGFVDAMFTSTSAVCVTGLATVDPIEFSHFGQIVLLCLIQIGGLGIMTITTFLFMLIGKKISLRERLIIKESLNEDTMSGLVRTIKKILVFVFTTETLGAILLTLCFKEDFPLTTSIYYGVFHSVSAFCNAGFDILPTAGASLIDYVGNVPVNLIIMALITLGGIGFIVIFDLSDRITKGKSHKLFLHTKIVLILSLVLIIGGALFFMISEWNNPNTLGNLPTGTKILASFFQSVTTRTAGFNTIAQDGLTLGSKFISMIMMFIGASPAGTGGGLKTTTMFLVVALAMNYIKGKEDINIFKKRINHKIVMKAATVFVIGLIFIVVATMALCIVNPDICSFDGILYEVFSAFGTVGLSYGITPFISVLGKFVLMITMFAGRVGFTTIVFAISHRQYENESGSIKYPEDKIIVG